MEKIVGGTSTGNSLQQYKIVLPSYTEKERESDAKVEEGFFYIPNFISEQEEEFLIDKIKSSPKPKWKDLQARRLQYWGGQVTAKQTLIPESMPDFLCKFPPLIDRIRATGAFEGSKHGLPNHCLINEYLVGQGIMPHEDGGAYFAAVATISLRSHTLLDIYRYAQTNDGITGEQESFTKPREKEPRFSVFQERRSLLVTRGAAYRDFLHGIAERQEDDAKCLRWVVNDEVLTQSDARQAVKASKAGEEASLMRDTRYSLTFRDVEKVAPNSLARMLGQR